MKDVTLLVWLTQMGLSIAVPLGGFIFLALWLHNSCGWGRWVIFAGIGLGLYSAFEGLRASVRAMQLILWRSLWNPVKLHYMKPALLPSALPSALV